MGSVLWDITQRIMAIPYRRFGSTCRFPSPRFKLDCLTLEDGTNYVIRRVTCQKNEDLIYIAGETLNHKKKKGYYSSSLFWRVLGLAGSGVQPLTPMKVLKVPRLRPLLLLIVVLRWKWTWSIGGMSLTDCNLSTLSNTYPSATLSTPSPTRTGPG
jgi:hypothetical protein